ncbi:MAG TPA: alpha/beta hydrolase [Blastocatellia bacterium]|nr:alpha/beta hydrolase [Blastocatellia bacterium]
MIRMICAGVLLTVLLLPAEANAQEKAQNQGISGDWSGVLDVGAAKLTLVLHLAQDATGALSAKVDSPDQGASGIPVDTVTFAGQTLKFEMKQLMASYEGTLNSDGTEISGKFTQGGVSFPLTLKRGVKPKEPPKRPQEPKPPYPYREEEVSYENKAAEGVRLAGTLTLPKSQGPFPAVLLITGSGPQDRNEALLGHKPFLVLADHLTRQGIAVLRVDDRGIGKSTGKFSLATSEDFASDALAGIEYLKSRPEINPKQIGLIGHSEGGLIAPMVAAKSKDVAFIVLMAGPGVTGEEILYEQGALMSRAAGAKEDAIEENRKTQAAMFAIVKSEKDAAAAEKQLREMFAKQLAELPEEQRKQAIASQAAIEAQIKQVNSPWFRYFLTYDPRPTLRQVRIPVLAVNGELDLQVPPKQNLPEIDKALKAAGNRDYKLVELPKLNHLFQTAQTGGFAEYEKIEETISPTALNTISDWILARTAKSGK